MIILYENKDLAFCQKEVGILSEISEKEPSLATEFLNKYGYAGIVHRIDRVVGGVIVYGKNKGATAYLSKLATENKLCKEYLAVVEGIPENHEGEFRDFLFKDSSKNKVFVVKSSRKGVKEAVLFYEVQQTVYTDKKPLTLVKIRLQTGRTHQIRVQFSSRKMPLAGDGKYGSKDNKCTVSLWSHRISFYSEKDKSELSAVSNPPTDVYPWNLFNIIN